MRSTSATGCRSITTRRRCARWRRMSTRSPTNYNVDSGDGWIADYFFDGLRKLSGGKPVLVSEWFFAARENRTGNRNNGHLMTVATQDERAAGAAAATAQLSRRSRKSSGPTGSSITTTRRAGAATARITISGWSISTTSRIERLTAALAIANRRVRAVHASAAASAAPAAPARMFVLPHASISVDDHSLSDWPKPSSLLPRLKAVAGRRRVRRSLPLLERARPRAGDNRAGLFRHRPCSPMRAPFRSSTPTGSSWASTSAAGPRRFTLFFIPPRTKLHDHPEMAAQLCAGPAQAGDHDRAAPKSAAPRPSILAPTSRGSPPKW